MKRKEEISALFDKWNQAVQSGNPDNVVAMYAFNTDFRRALTVILAEAFDVFLLEFEVQFCTIQP